MKGQRQRASRGPGGARKGAGERRLVIVESPAKARTIGGYLGAGERVRGALHIQTVNSRHSQIKGFLRGFRGIATKYLDSYLRWFHLIELGDQPSPRACLKAAMARPCLRFAN